MRRILPLVDDYLQTVGRLIQKLNDHHYSTGTLELHIGQLKDLHNLTQARISYVNGNECSYLLDDQIINSWVDTQVGDDIFFGLDLYLLHVSPHTTPFLYILQYLRNVKNPTLDRITFHAIDEFALASKTAN